MDDTVANSGDAMLDGKGTADRDLRVEGEVEKRIAVRIHVCCVGITIEEVMQDVIRVDRDHQPGVLLQATDAESERHAFVTISGFPRRDNRDSALVQLAEDSSYLREILGAWMLDRPHKQREAIASRMAEGLCVVQDRADTFCQVAKANQRFPDQSNNTPRTSFGLSASIV